MWVYNVYNLLIILDDFCGNCTPKKADFLTGEYDNYKS